MSTVKANNHQIGQSGTATNNFTLYQPSTPDGTVRLAVGNSGATTGDVLSVSNTGLSVTGTLSATGNVSFDGGTFVFNESGADKDFRIEGDTDANLFFTDASTDRVGIGTSSPGAQLQLNKSGTGDYTTFRLSNSGTSGKTYEIGVGGNTSASGYANNLYFYDSTAGALRMTLDTSGNLGLGSGGTTSIANQRFLIYGSSEGGTLNGIYVHNDSFSAGNARIALSPRYSFAYNTSPYIQSVSESTTAAALTFGTTTGGTVTERARITSGGVLDLATGAGAVGQIQFPATQVASSNANTLDDYEEGTWTPSLQGGNTAGTPVTGSGYYTKIGNVVTVFFRFENVSKPSGASGDAIIAGLPCPINSSIYSYGAPGLIYTNGGTSITAPNWSIRSVDSGSFDRFYFQYQTNVNANVSSLQIADLGATGNYFRGYFSYQTST